MSLNSSPLPLSRRSFIKSGVISAAATALYPLTARAGEKSRNLTAMVIERLETPGMWHNISGLRAQAKGGKLIGAKMALAKAGFKVLDVDLNKPFEEQPAADLLVLGSYISCHDDITEYLQANSEALQAFAEAHGGVILQLVEAPPYTNNFYRSSRPIKETSPFFLPRNGPAVKRTRETFWDLYVREPDHPLLEGMDIEEQDGLLRWKLSEKFAHTASWMPIGQRKEFKVLVGHDEADSRAALVEAVAGKGRYLLCSIFLDKLVDENGAYGPSAAFVSEAERFFANLHNYVGQHRATQSPAISAGPVYSDPPPSEFEDGSFTLVLIPDTQYYCQTEALNHHFHNLTDWIIDKRDELNIQYALHLGDVVNRGGIQMFQWDVAAAAMHKLDDHVPYAIALGNHDYTDDRSRSRDTPLNDFFHPSNYAHWDTFGGVLDPGHLENSWHTFRAHDTDFLILALEFGPRDHVLDWANSIVEKHPHHRVILITHAYTYSDSRRYNIQDRANWQMWNPHSYRSEGGNNDGQDMWDKLVNQHPNFLFVASGHVINDGLGRKTSYTQFGNPVHQMLFNYQGVYEGGLGSIRLLHFLPDRKTIQVRTLSTSLNKFATGMQEQFTLQI